MPKKRFSNEQIAFALRLAESGTAIGEICRKMGIAEAAFYCWKKVYAGMGVAEIRCLKQLEDENSKLKRLVADLTLVRETGDTPQDDVTGCTAKKVMKPTPRREIVRHYQAAFKVSERRACQVRLSPPACSAAAGGLAREPLREAGRMPSAYIASTAKKSCRSARNVT